jgi:hypothetical protein
MQMIHRRRRLAARFLAVGLLAATLFTVDSVTSPRPAEARCNGVNNPVKSTFSYGGYVRVSETPGAGTCNGNNIYTGVLKDERADGYCVHVQFKETGYPWLPPSPYGNVCGAGNTVTFQWEDRNGNSYAYQHFCIVRSSNNDLVACGWGNNIDSYGVNHGY